MSACERERFESEENARNLDLNTRIAAGDSLGV